MTYRFEVIDLFAGPGGLGEGFSAYKDSTGNHPFKIKLSIEKEASAHKTLQLRAFYRQFREGEVPALYYEFLEGKKGKDPEEIYRDPRYRKEAHAAAAEARQLTLGEDNRTINSEITNALSGYMKPWVLIGGPPCQAYSVVGRARNSGKAGYDAQTDHRNFLYKEYLKVIARFQPDVFVMENVKGLLSAKVGEISMFEEIRRDLQCPAKALKTDDPKTEYSIFSLVPQSKDRSGEGLDPEDFVIKSELFGIPQTRHRVILLGIRNDHARRGTPGTLKQADPINAKNIIDDLPKLRSGLSRTEDSFENWVESIRRGIDKVIYELIKLEETQLADRMGRVIENLEKKRLERGSNWAVATTQVVNPSVGNAMRKWYRDPGHWRKVVNHDTRAHMAEDLHRYLFCACFGKQYYSAEKFTPKVADFPKALAPDHVNWESGHFVDRFRVQNGRRIATTITSHISKDGHYFIHYDPYQCRSLTVREAARIQTFPDNYFFVGNRTEQYVQVGNAVPPYLAYKIADIVNRILEV